VLGTLLDSLRYRWVNYGYDAGPQRRGAVEDWSDPTANQYGVKATTRFGLGVLRSNAIAKMTNIKTTL